MELVPETKQVQFLESSSGQWKNGYEQWITTFADWVETTAGQQNHHWRLALPGRSSSHLGSCRAEDLNVDAECENGCGA